MRKWSSFFAKGGKKNEGRAADGSHRSKEEGAGQRARAFLVCPKRLNVRMSRGQGAKASRCLLGAGMGKGRQGAH